MLVNNETGARYDVEGAFKTAKETVPGAVLHCDAVQGYMKIPFTAASLGADMITISAHKTHGPKGVGALYIKDDIIRAKKTSPIIYGGGHEGGLRSGTENVPAILGFAAAIKALSENFAALTKRCSDVREHIINTLKIQCRDVKINIPPVAAPHILSLTVPGIKSETMLNYLSSCGICVSSGSACSSHGKLQSRALAAFGLSAADADTTIRLSFSGENTTAEADEFISALKDGIKRLCKI
jgi:cysteine desulfurase